MNTIIIAQESGSNIRFQIAHPVKGLSDIYTLENRARYLEGNPYSIYGKQVEEFVGQDKFSQNLIMSIVSSGTL